MSQKLLGATRLAKRPDPGLTMIRPRGAIPEQTFQV
jgi:hypothetical protein